MARIGCRLQGGLGHGLKAAVTAFALLVATIPAARAQTFTVTTGGVTYDVVGLGIGQSFADNEAAIRAAPWWGDQGLANDIAVAVRAVSGPTPYHAVYAFLEINTFFSASIYRSSVSSLDPDSLGGLAGDKSVTSTSGAPFNFFTGSIATPVPELDAPALLQALFILMAFGLWLRARPPHARETRAASRPTSRRTRG